MIARRLLGRPASALSRASAWTCPSCVRRAPFLQRNISIPPLSNFDPIFEREGVAGLLSQGGFSIAWTRYQSMIIERLNELTAGEPYEDKDPKDIVLQFARDPMAASLFNYASMAHNNHFFFQSLSTNPKKLDDFKFLRDSLESHFGSIETLKITMLDTAASMFGPGFVWLVWCPQLSPAGRGAGGSGGAWRILTTYNAGTPYPEAGYRRQSMDMNTNNENSTMDYSDFSPSNSVGSFGGLAVGGKAQAGVPPGSTPLVPVLCVSTWEHTYLRDYGPEGKALFLETWWDVIEWGVVFNRTPRGATSRY